MGNILYIGEDIIKASNGGDVINQRNIHILKTVYDNSFFIYPLKRISRLTTFVNLLLQNVGLIRYTDYSRIFELIRAKEINEVFLWSSKLGKLAQKIKKKYPHIHIIAFFHNIEKQYYEEELKINCNFKNYFLAYVVDHNEKKTIENSSTLITLNNRDSELLERYYGREASFELPTSFVDVYNFAQAQQYVPMPNGIIRLLFVGFNFFANTKGIAWFIENVLPELPQAHLTIVGKNMELAFENSVKVTVCGYVDDLADYYYNADIVVQPIFHGGGMKTKTAEALMYGCPIVGTSESFEGYELEYNKIGGMANNKEDMIMQIQRLCDDRKRLCEARRYARNIFEQKYSLNKSVSILKTKIK